MSRQRQMLMITSLLSVLIMISFVMQSMRHG